MMPKKAKSGSQKRKEAGKKQKNEGKQLLTNFFPKKEIGGSRMPISSGAAGRVGVGVDTSIAWAPSGVKQESRPSYRNCDSYLKRYLETHPEIRQRCPTTSSENVTDQSCSPGQAGDSEINHCKELSTATISQQLCGTSVMEADGDPPRPQTSSKSSVCAIL